MGVSPHEKVGIAFFKFFLYLNGIIIISNDDRIPVKPRRGDNTYIKNSPQEDAQ